MTVNLEPAKEKLETELLFLKYQHSRLKRPFRVRNDISNRYSKDFVYKTKQKRNEKIVFPYGNKFHLHYRLT